jgi:hypothetical protein
MNRIEVRQSRLLEADAAPRTGSAAVHLGSRRGHVLARPRLWPVDALGAVVLDHLLITAAGTLAAQRLAGSRTGPPSARGRAAERGDIAITIDDGPDPEVTPARVSTCSQRFEARRELFLRRRARELRYPDLAQRNRAPRPQRRESLPAAPALLFSARPPRHGRGNRRGAGKHCSGDGPESALFPCARGTAQSLSRAHLDAAQACAWRAGRAAASIPSTQSRCDVFRPTGESRCGRRYLAAARRQRGARMPRADPVISRCCRACSDHCTPAA